MFGRAEPGPDFDNSNVEKQESQYEDIDGGYGWVNVTCMLLLTAQTWGVNAAFGVYLAYYIDSNHFPGATTLNYAFVGGLSLSQITLIAPVVTHFNRKLGLRATLLTGAVLEVCALIAASFATQIWHLCLAQGILFGWGCGFQYIGASGVLSQWFTKRRAFANSLASGGSGMGGLIWCLATGTIINSLGFGWSLRITGLITFSINIICALLMKDRNHHFEPNQRAFDVKLLNNREFCLLLVWGVFSMLGYTIFLFSLPSYTTSIGFTQHQGAIVGAMVSLGMVIGRPIIGFYSDTVGGINMATGATFLGSLVCFLVWMFANSYGVLILTAILGGSVIGTFWATTPYLTSDAVGMKELPSALSIIWISVVLPCLFAEPIALTLQRNSKPSNKSVQIFAGSMFLAGAISLIFLRKLKVERLRAVDREPRSEPAAVEEKGARSGNLVGRWLRTAFSWGKF